VLDAARGDALVPFLNLALRGATLLARFVLLFMLGKFLGVAEVGAFGVATATISWLFVWIGFDFYVYATREMAAASVDARAPMLRSQIAFHGVSYLIAIPVLGVMRVADLVPASEFPAMCTLLVLEHVGWELYRYLVMSDRPLIAGVTWFLRSALWVYALGAVMWLVPGARRLDLVWATWAGGSLAGIAFGVANLHEIDWRRVRAARPDWRWVRVGVTIAFPYFASNAAVRGLGALERYFVWHSHGAESAGVYSMHAGIASGVATAVDAVLFSVLGSTAIRLAAKGDPAVFGAFQRSVLVRAGAFATLAALAVAALAPLLLRVTNHPSYIAELPTLWILVAAGAVFAQSSAVQLVLFAMRRDVAVWSSAVAGVCVTVLVAAFAVPRFGPRGAAIADLLGMSTILCLRLLALRRPIPPTS
jgi:O-antigen/teichoic acid export membrane protein